MLNGLKFKSSRNVGILVGGSPGERKVVVEMATAIFNSLRKTIHKPFIIDLNRYVIEKLKAYCIDVVFIVDAIFLDTNKEISQFLNNKSLRQILEDMSIPYTGSNKEAAMCARNKIASKKAFKNHGLPTPAYTVVNLKKSLENEGRRIAKILEFPFIVKPRDEAASIGVNLIENIQQFVKVITALRKKFTDIFAERFVQGIEVTVPILEIDGIPVPLTVIEMDHKSIFYSFEVKERYRGKTLIYHVPARLNGFLFQYIQQVAVEAHKSIGCSNYSRIDLIIDRNETPYILELNSLPILPTWAARIEWLDFDNLVLQIIKNAIWDKKK